MSSYHSPPEGNHRYESTNRLNDNDQLTIDRPPACRERLRPSKDAEGKPAPALTLTLALTTRGAQATAEVGPAVGPTTPSLPPPQHTKV